MFTRPASISDSTILEMVTELWTVDADRAEYSPVGFGSHHWLLGTAHGWKRFVTVDDLVAKGRSPLEPSDGTSRDGSAAAIYSAAGGPQVDDELLCMYRLQWDLMEIADYISLFCAAHEDTEDSRESLRNLRHYIAPRR